MQYPISLQCDLVCEKKANQPNSSINTICVAHFKLKFKRWTAICQSILNEHTCQVPWQPKDLRAQVSINSISRCFIKKGECNSLAKNVEHQKSVENGRLCLTCNWVNILLDPVICWFNFKKCPINRLNSFRFMLSNSETGTKRSIPNSRLKQQITILQWASTFWKI